jgi:Domain of unknown function (DU1801)
MVFMPDKVSTGPAWSQVSLPDDGGVKVKSMKPSAALSPEDFIAGLDEPRRSEVAKLHAIVRKTVPKLKPLVAGKMLGYGAFHYKYASGREGDTFRIAISSNKSYISLYLCAADAKGYIAERYKKRLPGASIGKGCVRFKRTGDLDLAALQDLLREAAAQHGNSWNATATSQPRPASA